MDTTEGIQTFSDDELCSCFKILQKRWGKSKKKKKGNNFLSKVGCGNYTGGGVLCLLATYSASKVLAKPGGSRQSSQ